MKARGAVSSYSQIEVSGCERRDRRNRERPKGCGLRAWVTGPGSTESQREGFSEVMRQGAGTPEVRVVERRRDSTDSLIRVESRLNSTTLTSGVPASLTHYLTEPFSLALG